MVKGIEITDKEIIFLKKEFEKKYPNVRTDKNSITEFNKVAGVTDAAKRGVSASTWRNLFHHKSPYHPLDTTLNEFYTHLLERNRTHYLMEHPDRQAEFRILNTPKQIETIGEHLIVGINKTAHETETGSKAQNEPNVLLQTFEKKK